ncbi:MAG: mannose-6-phosphate isomerase-like protein (cupin superfamily) [Myxococcota bacterium]|jgi:mannose-6-phosphate isomerase-like protein (cupin superfamily)
MSTTYDISLEPLHAGLETIDAGALADGCPVPWWNRTLCQANDTYVRLGVFLGTFHWHHHDTEDEVFFVLEGLLLLDIRDADGSERTVELGPRQAMLVPHGVVHRTRAEERTVVLMVEPATVVPTGDG